MKTLLVALVLVVLAVPATVNAQDWVMDWTSSGSSIGVLTGPYAEGWSISGSSPVTLTPQPPSFRVPTDFSAPVDLLVFHWEGRTYGGIVSEQTNFQGTTFVAPVPCAGVFTTTCSIVSPPGPDFGSFAFTDPNHFSLDVFVGTPHSFTEVIGTGTRTTVGAIEPSVLLVSAAGLFGAVALRRSRRS